jgi:hypothetical protein
MEQTLAAAGTGDTLGRARGDCVLFPKRNMTNRACVRYF